MKFFDALTKPFGWAGNKWSRVMDPGSVSELDDRVFGGRIQDRTQGVPWYKTASDPGSLMFGRADQRNSLGMERQGNKGGFFGDKAQGIDWAGSPVTAGTNWQGAARLGAILYGLWAGNSALANSNAATGSSAGSDGTAGGGAAPTADATPVTGTTSGGASSSGGALSSSPAWSQYLRQGAPRRQQQAQPYQVQNTFYDDGTQQTDAQLLAQLLRQY